MNVLYQAADHQTPGAKTVQPFTVQCTTCNRSLRVTSPEAVGQILACPKCGSMVMVEAPPGWSLDESGQVPASGTPALLSASTFIPPKPSQTPPPSATPSKAAAKLVGDSAPVQKATAWKDPPPSATPPGETLPQPAPTRNRAASDAPRKSTTAPKSASPAPAKIPVAAMPAPVTPPVVAPTPVANAVPSVADTAPPVSVPPVPDAVHPAAGAWPRWFLPGAAATVGLGVVIFILRLLLQPSEGEPVSVAQSPPSATTATETPPPETPPSITKTPDESSADTTPADTTSPEATTNDTTAPTTGSGDPASGDPATGNASSSENVAQPSEVPGSTPTLTPPTAAPPEQPQPPIPQPAAPTEPETTPPAAPPSAADVPPEPKPSASTLATSDPPVIAPPAAGADQPPADPGVPPVPSMARVPPRQVDLEARLADPVRAIEVRSLPLYQYLDLVSRLSTIPISLDLDAFEQLGRSPTAPVTVQLHDKTIADALAAALGAQGLGYDLDRGLVVGRPQREAMRKIPYTLTDLAPDDAAMNELAATVRQLIAPQSWHSGDGGTSSGSTSSGSANLAVTGGKLVVEQTPAVHYQLLVLCEKLRVARGLPIKSKYDPAKFALTTRSAKARELLAKPLQANFSQPQPLASVVDWLRHATKATILIDHAALADAETSAESHCASASGGADVANGKPLAALLDELLTPMELTWRAVDATTIEITTPAAAAERDEIEFYPVKSLASDAAAGEALAAQIKAQLGPAAADGQLGVVVHYDARSKTLIVRAPQRLQAKVESFLAQHSQQK